MGSRFGRLGASFGGGLVHNLLGGSDDFAMVEKLLRVGSPEKGNPGSGRPSLRVRSGGWQKWRRDVSAKNRAAELELGISRKVGKVAPEAQNRGPGEGPESVHFGGPET